MRDPDRDSQGKPAPSQQPGQGTLSVEDFGAEAQLSIKQQVPWKVALKILELLKADSPPNRDQEGSGNPP